MCIRDRGESLTCTFTTEAETFFVDASRYGLVADGTTDNTLKYGDSGSRVTELQTALVKLGYDTNGVDGRFGAGTQRAVISFQKDNGLEADGLAGTKTLELLYAKANGSGSSSGSSSGTSTGLTRTLRRGLSLIHI